MAADTAASLVQPLLDDSDKGAAEAPPQSHAAAVHGDVDALRALSVEALSEEYYGLRAMHLAAAHNELAAMDLIMQRTGCGVDVRDQHGRTPLTHAILGRAEEAVVWLVRGHQADTALTDDCGRRGIHVAAMAGSVSLFALLGNLGVDVRASDAEGKMPLQIAAAEGNLQLVEYMVLVRGCDDEDLAAVLPCVQPGPCAFWLERCLRFRVGCHERAPDDSAVCGPVAGGCGVPLASLRFRGPEYTHVEARQLSVLSGLLALAAGSLLVQQQQEGAHSDLQNALGALSMLCTCCGSVCFMLAACTSLERVDVSDVRRRDRYVVALDHAAGIVAGNADGRAQNWWGERAPMIHQLQIVGPPRSKYCPAARACVPVFDHYCGFLRNSVARRNYPAFCGTIVFSAVSCSCLMAGAIVHLSTAQGSFVYVGIAVYFSAFAALWLTLIVYHTLLAALGLTTNERIAMQKALPPYLVDADTRMYSNPYDHGFLRNLWYRIRPRRGTRKFGADEEIAADLWGLEHEEEEPLSSL